MIMALLIITNGYEGIMKSNYMVNTEHKTKWTVLKDLQNFTLYISSHVLPVDFGYLCEEANTDWNKVMRSK